MADSPPPGLVGFFDDEVGRRFYVLTPMPADGSRVCAILESKGQRVPCSIIPRSLGPKDSYAVVKPRGRKYREWSERDVEGIQAALNLWQMVFADVAKAVNSQGFSTREEIERALFRSPGVANLLLKACKKPSGPGFPKSHETFLKTLVALVNFGAIWRFRKAGTPQHGQSWDAAAVFVNDKLNACFPAWSGEWKYPKISAKSLDGIISRYGLETALPPRGGWRVVRLSSIHSDQLEGRGG